MKIHSKSLSSGRTRKAFTLLELIVALAIFVGSVAAISRLVIIGLENAEYSQMQAMAEVIAEDRFAELDAGILTVDDSGSGADPNFPDWQYSFTAEAMDLTGLYLITVEVQNTSKQGAQNYRLRLSRVFFDETAVETESSTETDESSGASS